MREIKFRAWDKQDNKMSETFFIYETPTWLLRNGGYTRDLEECDLMQYTGLKDKNGKEIYEGDIVQFYPSVHRRSTQIRFIGWSDTHACFTAEEKGRGDWHLRTMIDFDGEVIGNIYENLELVKDGR